MEKDLKEDLQDFASDVLEGMQDFENEDIESFPSELKIKWSALRALADEIRKLAR